MSEMTLAEAEAFLTPFAEKCWDARSDMIYGRENGQAGRALKVVLAALSASGDQVRREGVDPFDDFLGVHADGNRIRAASPHGGGR